MTRRVWIVATAVAFGVATWLFGWWAVPMVAVIVGATQRVRPLAIAIAALAAWSLLLVIDSVGPGMKALTDALAGVMGVPAIAVIVLTWLFPTLLAWSFGTIGRSLR